MPLDDAFEPLAPAKAQHHQLLVVRAAADAQRIPFQAERRKARLLVETPRRFVLGRHGKLDQSHMSARVIKDMRHERLVWRFRNSPRIDGGLGANFGITGHTRKD
jgi:hypothetical protein